MTPLLGILGLIGVFVLILTIIRFARGRKHREEAEEERARMIEEGIKLGHLTKEGHAACVICGHRATENAPQTGQSWLDGISFLSRLFGLPPRYIIVDAEGRGYEYCKIHKDVAVAQLEQFHGLLRAERAAFNAEQAGKVAKMDGGGVQLKVRQHYNEVVDHLKMTLDKDYEQVRHLLPVASQSDHTAVSTLSSTPKEDDPLDFSDVS
jgi:hypothetical protein